MKVKDLIEHLKTFNPELEVDHSDPNFGGPYLNGIKPLTKEDFNIEEGYPEYLLISMDCVEAVD